MGQALIACCKINCATTPGCSCFSCFQQKTLSVVQINPVLPYLTCSPSTAVLVLSSLLSAHLQCIQAGAASCLLVWREKAKVLHCPSPVELWSGWSELAVVGAGALVFHPAFLSSSLSVHTCSQNSKETHGELNGSELPGQSGTTWSNNPMVNAFPPCSLTVLHHPRGMISCCICPVMLDGDAQPSTERCCVPALAQQAPASHVLFTPRSETPSFSSGNTLTNTYGK